MRIRIILLLLLILSVFTSFYFIICIILALTLLVLLIHNMGKKLLVLESIALYSSIIYLIIPMIGYKYYTISNPLSKLWVTYFKVSEETYFEFTLPAILLFIFGLFLFTNKSEGHLIQNILIFAQNKINKVGRLPIYLVLFSVACFYISPYAPSFLQYILYIFFLTIFPAVTYLYFDTNRDTYSKLVIFGVILWLIYNALITSMFTVIVYMGISFFGLLLLKNRYSFLKKTILVIVIISFTIILQFTKKEYRTLSRNNLIKDSNFGTFISLYRNNIKDIYGIFDANAFFPIYVRVNQGIQLASVMQYMPSRKPHDQGSQLGKSILASVVPRLFWPDKPESGGKNNMKYYANIYLDTTSMNVGPIGEGYGAFGKWGGIFYMFIFGTFLGWVYNNFIRLTIKRPLLLFWQPLLFYEVIFCMENDTMQALNSLIKISFLLFILFKLFPGLIGLKDNSVRSNQLALG